MYTEVSVINYFQLILKIILIEKLQLQLKLVFSSGKVYHSSFITLLIIVCINMHVGASVFFFLNNFYF
jgi:hypothetical protein